MATGEVINQLLHHVGAMCIHQLNLLAASSNSLPLGALLGKQHPIEARHFSSICDIMEKAMVNRDACIIRCILVVFQVSFIRYGAENVSAMIVSYFIYVCFFSVCLP